MVVGSDELGVEMNKRLWSYRTKLPKIDGNDILKELIKQQEIKEKKNEKQLG